MNIQTQYDEILKLKKEINKRMDRLDFQGIKELMVWLAGVPVYKRLKNRDNQLHYLDFACSVWLEEKKRLAPQGIQEDFFTGLHSLDELETKYLAVEFAVLRMEYEMPEEYYEQAADTIIHYQVTGLAIYKIIRLETVRHEQNLLRMAQLLKGRGQYIRALILLHEGASDYPENQDICLEQADCWLQGQQWDMAYKCLKKMPNPNQELRELLRELEKLL